MTKPHVFDRYVGSGDGKQNVLKRELGNILLKNAKVSAQEWSGSVDRFSPTDADLDALPHGSWLLRLGFTLANPFTSKTETEFHPYEERDIGRPQHEWLEVQNPIVRDHLTGLPLVKPTTWKGHLRFAARMAGVSGTTICRLFGESLRDEAGKAGRLRFFPTFFTEDVQREVVTPLSRNTRTPARGPIDIEVVPSGATGTFCLLYIPHPKGPAWSTDHIADDLQAVTQTLRVMFLEYGFSAKKTSGWGVVEDSVTDGRLWARGLAWPPPEKAGERGEAPPFEAPDDAYLALMDEAGMPRAGLRKSDGTWASNKEFRALADQPCSLGVYKRFRSWYDVHGAVWQRQLMGREAHAAVPIRTYTVESVTALCDLATRLAEAMRKGGANG